MSAAESAETFLRERWRRLRDSSARPEVTFTLGAIEALRVVGVLTADEAELWERRIASCPGHEDEGGRKWCAYCGVMPGRE